MTANEADDADQKDLIRKTRAIELSAFEEKCRAGKFSESETVIKNKEGKLNA